MRIQTLTSNSRIFLPPFKILIIIIVIIIVIIVVIIIVIIIVIIVSTQHLRQNILCVLKPLRHLTVIATQHLRQRVINPLL